MRLLRKEGKNGTFNPLEQLVEKIRRLRNLNRSAYEINFVDDDLEEILEIPIYSTKDDYKLHIPQPCLSHLTFKLYEGESLRLTVLYRSHFYVTKALGNLLGLAQLQSFVAAETGLEVGPLVCHSTHARIDTGKGVTLQRVEKLIAACRDAMRSEEVVEQ
jgi:thymidylate synthase